MITVYVLGAFLFLLNINAIILLSQVALRLLENEKIDKDDMVELLGK